MGVRMLEFESPVYELEGRIEKLKRGGCSESSSEVARLEERLQDLERRIYRDLSPWDRVLLARHPQRPTTRDYISMICDDFLELHGDRCFGDDTAIIGGIARIEEKRLMVVGHEKGRNTKEKIRRNFGMARPEGFRKTLRLMRMAEKYSLPIVSFIDTPGAYPGVGAEERGQSRAIAENLKEIFDIATPVVVVIIGEGGSGGALALAVGDRVLMLENAVYSVISPEGCAAILWKSKERAPDAAASLRLTARDCLECGVVDTVIEELHGASHRDPEGNAAVVKRELLAFIKELEDLPADVLLGARREKYFSIGYFEGKGI